MTIQGVITALVLISFAGFVFCIRFVEDTSIKFFALGCMWLSLAGWITVLPSIDVHITLPPSTKKDN